MLKSIRFVALFVTCCLCHAAVADAQAGNPRSASAAKPAWAVSDSDLSTQTAAVVLQHAGLPGRMQEVKSAAANGHRLAMTLMSLAALSGVGMPRDPALGLEWAQKSAAAGDARGMMILSDLYKEGLGIAEDPKQALAWCRKAMEQGNAIAQESMGLRYIKGVEVPLDKRSGFKLLEAAAEQGFASAQVNAGKILHPLDGDGRRLAGDVIPVDVPRALAWFQKAAAQGHPLAMYWIAVAYDSGVGAPKDSAVAVQWWRKAADAGSVRAKVQLGFAYETSRGVLGDYAEAIRLYQEAIAAGDDYAFFRLGGMYLEGRGVTNDDRRAFELYAQGAERGSVESEVNLAQMYVTGRGVAKDSKLALHWALKSLERNPSPWAHYYAGHAYRNLGQFTEARASMAKAAAGNVGNSNELAAKWDAEAAASPITDPIWGPYAKLAGHRWLSRTDKFNAVVEYSWKVPGRVLVGTSRELAKTHILITDTYTYQPARGVIEKLATTGIKATETVNPDGTVTGVASGYGYTSSYVVQMIDDEHVRWTVTTRNKGGKIVSQGDHTALRVTGANESALAASYAKAKPSDGAGWLKFFNAAVNTAEVLSDTSGKAYNNLIAEKVPALAPVADAANTLIDAKTGSTNANPGGSSASGKGAVTPGSYPARPNTLQGHPACAGYTVDNYKAYFDSHANGPDVQLHTLCAGAYNYYWMYLNAIRQGYSQPESDRTYAAFQDAGKVATDFYQKTRVR